MTFINYFDSFKCLSRVCLCIYLSDCILCTLFYIKDESIEMVKFICRELDLYVLEFSNYDLLFLTPVMSMSVYLSVCQLHKFCGHSNAQTTARIFIKFQIHLDINEDAYKGLCK